MDDKLGGGGIHFGARPLLDLDVDLCKLEVISLLLQT